MMVRCPSASWPAGTFPASARDHGKMKVDYVDVIAGALVALVGLLAIAQAASYSIGTVAHMGPGYFPMLLGGVLMLLGLGIAIFDSRSPKRGDVDALVPVAFTMRLRALALLTAAPIAFALLIEPAGLLPAVFATVFISAFADGTADLKRATFLAIGVTTLSVLVFKIGLKLPIDMIG